MKRNETINLFCCVTLHTCVNAEMTYTRAHNATANKHQTTEKLYTQNPAKNASHQLILIHLFNSYFCYFSLCPSITAHYIGRCRWCEYSVLNLWKQNNSNTNNNNYPSFTLHFHHFLWLVCLFMLVSFECRRNWFELDSVSHHHIITLSFIIVCLSFKDYAYASTEENAVDTISFGTRSNWRENSFFFSLSNEIRKLTKSEKRKFLRQ